MKHKYAILTAVALLCLFTSHALANSGPPPALIVIAQGAPEDAAVVSVETGSAASRQTLAWETYYVFQYGDFGEGFLPSEATIRVTGAGKSFERTLDLSALRGYDAVVSLDFTNETFTPGKLFLRSVLLIFLRLIATLIIEGALFFLFGFRQRRSRLCFLLVNVVTQGALGLWINAAQPLFAYAIFGFLGIELLILIAEPIAFAGMLKEHKPSRRAVYALVANIASLFLGGYLLNALPV